MEFVQKHTDDRFFLIDNRASSVRDKIAREVIVNTLAHREYSSAFPAKLIITPSELYTENWNKSATFGQLTPQNFTPYPKNPLIARFFVNIGFADSLGSGVRNLYEFSKIYSGTEPKIEEGDVFKTTVKLYVKEISSNNTNVPQNVSQNVPQNVPQNYEERIVAMIKQNPNITRKDIAEALGVTIKTIGRKLSEITNIRYVGSAKGGHWEIISNP